MKYAVCTQRKYSIESLSFAISWHSSHSWSVSQILAAAQLTPFTASSVYTGIHRWLWNNWSKNTFSKELHRLLKWNVPDFSLVLLHSSTFVNEELDCCREQVQGTFQMCRVETVGVSKESRKVRVTKHWHWLPGRLWNLIVGNNSKLFWTWSWATSLGVPAWARRLDKETSRGAFKPQPFCDCEIVPMEDYCEL